MTDVQLVPITKSNWKAVTELNLSSSQESYLPPNLYSIAEAQFYPDAQSKGIVVDDVLVGYVLFGIDDETNEWKIFRFMIDALYQGKGYGRLALNCIIKSIRSDNPVRPIKIAYQEDNKVAKHLYTKFGFVEEKVVDGVVTAVLSVTS